MCSGGQSCEPCEATRRYKVSEIPFVPTVGWTGQMTDVEPADWTLAKPIFAWA